MEILEANRLGRARIQAWTIASDTTDQCQKKGANTTSSVKHLKDKTAWNTAADKCTVSPTIQFVGGGCFVTRRFDWSKR